MNEAPDSFENGANRCDIEKGKISAFDNPRDDSHKEVDISCNPRYKRNICVHIHRI